MIHTENKKEKLTQYLKEAKENLYEEFSIALDIEKDNVEQYITDHL